MFDIVLPIIDSSMQIYVYTILCFSEMSLPKAYILPGFIVLTSPQEHSEYPFPRIFEVTLQDTTTRTLLEGK